MGGVKEYLLGGRQGGARRGLPRAVDDAFYVTGALLFVDGGMTAM
ncbi:MAG TPA: hypothetical protein VGL95_15740 [Acetobacteraceae bacterium]|jgi:hypothetical protein